MQVVRFFLKEANKIHKASNIKPDDFAGKTEEEIKMIQLWRRKLVA